jgi:hypothetical protein
MGEDFVLNEPPADQRLSLEGLFGEIVVDGERPCVRSLRLRQGNGDLGAKSLLSAWPSETLPYTTGAYSYVQDMAGVRYESTASRRHVVEKATVNEIVIRGIELLPDKLRVAAPVIEDWRFCLDPNGDLRWEISQTWQRDCEVRQSAAPGLFFNLRANAVPTGSGQRRFNPEQNGVAAMWWVCPEMLETPPYPHGQGELLPPYFLSCESSNHVVYHRRDAWAVAKLYTSFPNDRDLFLQASGGYLFRRGKYNSHNELGLLLDSGGQRYGGVSEASLYRGRKIEFAKGATARAALIIGSRAATDTGHQLAVEIPDKPMERSLALFYNGLANAGMWTSQQGYGTGNQVDGWMIGTFWMPAVALMTGVEARAPLSADPYSPRAAWRAEMERMLELVNAKGEIEHGFFWQRNREGHLTPEAGLVLLVRLEMYWLATGDTALVVEHLDKLARILDALVPYRKDDLLVFDRQVHKLLVYFDAWRPDGTVTYLNNWYVRAQQAFATLLTAAGRQREAAQRLAQREATLRAMNRLLWDDHAFGQGRGGYVDFIDPCGKRHGFFCSATEYLAIAFGVADERQAAAILKTADERIAELTRQFGYRGDATLDTLWPVESTSQEEYPFTTYQNGSVLNCWTYFEVLARCRCGEVDRACELLRRFAEHAGRTNWFEGDSAFNIRSEPHGWGHEPYLSDQVAVAAALIHGILGIQQTPTGVQVYGRLPTGWEQARAVVPCLGKHYEVLRKREGTSIRQVEHGLKMTPAKGER